MFEFVVVKEVVVGRVTSSTKGKMSPIETGLSLIGRDADAHYGSGEVSDTVYRFTFEGITVTVNGESERGQS